MGTYIYITLGRINRHKLEAPEVMSRTTWPLALPGAEKVTFDSLELDYYEPESDDCFQNYDLFSWLADVRGDLVPMVDADKLIHQTHEFLDWLKKEYGISEYRRTGKGSPWYDREDELEDELGMRGSPVFYPAAVLLSFDYDRKCRVQKEDGMQVDSEETYRENFPDNYFKLLDKLKEEKWDFVIFSFD